MRPFNPTHTPAAIAYGSRQPGGPSAHAPWSPTAPASAPASPSSPAVPSSEPLPFLATDCARRVPGGPVCMHPLPDSDLSDAAAFDRLNRTAARKEKVILDYVDHLAVCGITSSHHLDNFERASLVLWRLTAVRKTLLAIRAQLDRPNPNDHRPLAPILHATEEALSDIPEDSLGARTASSAPGQCPQTTDSSLQDTLPAEISDAHLESSSQPPAVDSPAMPSAPNPASSTRPAPANTIELKIIDDDCRAFCSHYATADCARHCPDCPHYPALCDAILEAESERYPDLFPPSIQPVFTFISSAGFQPASSSPSPPPSPFSALPAPHLDSPFSALRTPRLPSPSVPCCPSLSPSSMDRALTRVDRDFAILLPPAASPTNTITPPEIDNPAQNQDPKNKTQDETIDTSPAPSRVSTPQTSSITTFRRGP